MLLCSFLGRELVSGQVEVAAIGPLASMAAIQNPELSTIGLEVRNKLKAVAERL